MAKIPGVQVYCDVDNSEFQTPSIMTADEKRLNIVIVNGNLCMILELSVRFETNLRRNNERKFKNYKDLIMQLNATYNVKLVNLSMGAIGMDSNIQNIFIEMGLQKAEST